LDLLLGSDSSVDKQKMIIKIRVFSKIIMCDVALIWSRISWDQNSWLCTCARWR